MTKEEMFDQKMKEIAECRKRIQEGKCKECPNFLKKECVLLLPTIRKRLYP